MNSSLFARTNGVFQYPGDATTDFSAQTGLLAKASATAGLLAVNDSATVPAIAVILDGQSSALPTTMGVLGKIPPVRLLAAGAITKFTRVAQDAGGGVKASPGSGNARCDCGIALESSTTAGQYILVDTFAPAIGS